MASSHRPRKRRAAASPSPPPSAEARLRLPTPPPNAHLFIQAHEANLIYSQPKLASQVLSREEGGRMQCWTGAKGSDGEDIWVDRYDALHLLASLPPPPVLNGPASPPLSDSGFSDLPSDSEEMFFFPPEEMEEIRATKKRKKREQEWEERVKAREREDSKQEVSDDISETQLALMTQLALTLRQAKDRALLEIRILANHGHDPRFSFLRKGGKWREVWEKLQAAPAKPQGDVAAALGGLVSYGSDSDDSAGEENPLAAVGASTIDSARSALEVVPLQGPVDGDTAEERAKKDAKAEKAREWARKRKEARDAAQAPSVE